VALTGVLLLNYGVKQLPQLSARGVPASGMIQSLMLALPFIAAMTVPMAVFVAAAWVFTRLGGDGTLPAARMERGVIRRMVTPLVVGAAAVAALTLVLNTQILPRANTRLVAIMSDAAGPKSDREMTIIELRAAARSAREVEGPTALARASAYEVEIHKKFALAAACIVLALSGAAIGLRFPRGGSMLVIGASVVVFIGYYAALIAGETLAGRMLISPGVAMWAGNVMLLALALLLLWRRGSPRVPRAAELLAAGTSRRKPGPSAPLESRIAAR
jgi:lipopolysaccharide export LptBFGC system permease protein LptF